MSSMFIVCVVFVTFDICIGFIVPVVLAMSTILSERSHTLPGQLINDLFVYSLMYPKTPHVRLCAAYCRGNPKTTYRKKHT